MQILDLGGNWTYGEKYENWWLKHNYQSGCFGRTEYGGWDPLRWCHRSLSFMGDNGGGHGVKKADCGSEDERWHEWIEQLVEGGERKGWED